MLLDRRDVYTVVSLAAGVQEMRHNLQADARNNGLNIYDLTGLVRYLHPLTMPAEEFACKLLHSGCIPLHGSELHQAKKQLGLVRKR